MVAKAKKTKSRKFELKKAGPRKAQVKQPKAKAKAKAKVKHSNAKAKAKVIKADKVAANPFEGITLRTIDKPFAELLDKDTNADHILPQMRVNSPIEAGPATRVSKERYISREYHELEKEHLWSRVWQMAAHEDDFPLVGNVVPYDITDKSYLIVRTGEDEYKAYHNACLHRGRKLREYRGRGLKEIQCSFHGWTWNLDGTIKRVPCPYDYPDLEPADESLPEVKLGRWGRYIFINPDPDCEPLEDFLGDLSSEFELLPYERRYKKYHVAKIVRANWKVVQDAFSESYHVLATHPQGLTGGAHDMCTKYDVFGNRSRAIRTGALEGEGVLGIEPPFEAHSVPTAMHPLKGEKYESIADGQVRVTDRNGVTGVFTDKGQWISGELTDVSPTICVSVDRARKQIPLGVPLPSTEAVAAREAGQAKIRKKLGEGASERAILGEEMRMSLMPLIPSIAPTIPDVELTSLISHTVFPNFHPWGSFNELNYRFRPNGDNHEECIFEIIIMEAIPENGEYTPSPGIRFLGADDDLIEATDELSWWGAGFNQDVLNMEWIHKGMKASARDYVRFAQYNETKVRHFHMLYDEWVESEK